MLAEIARDVAALAAVPVVAIWSADDETRTLTAVPAPLVRLDPAEGR